MAVPATPQTVEELLIQVERARAALADIVSAVNAGENDLILGFAYGLTGSGALQHEEATGTARQIVRPLSSLRADALHGLACLRLFAANVRTMYLEPAQEARAANRRVDGLGVN